MLDGESYAGECGSITYSEGEKIFQPNGFFKFMLLYVGNHISM